MFPEDGYKIAVPPQGKTRSTDKRLTAKDHSLENEQIKSKYHADRKVRTQDPENFDEEVKSLVTEIIIGNPGYLQSTLILFQARTRNLLTVQESYV